MKAMKQYKVPRIKLSYVADVGTIDKRAIKCSSSVAELLRNTYDDGEIDFIETFKVLFLNNANKPLGVQTIGVGGTGACLVDLRILFAGALLAKASTIILCHNHPSGILNPSLQDDELTNRIKEGAKILDMRVIDHIILSRNSFYSYSDNGKL